MPPLQQCESDEISDLSATIRNVHPFCISGTFFIHYFFCASSISKRCVSMQFIRAIGGLISCRRHLHLAAFLFLFFCFLNVYGAATLSEGLPSAIPQSPPSTPSLNHVLGEMRREGEVDWPGPARSTEVQARLHLRGPHQTSAFLLRSLKPLVIPPFRIKSVKRRMSCDGATEGDISRANGELLLKDAKNCVCVDPQCII